MNSQDITKSKYILNMKHDFKNAIGVYYYTVVPFGLMNVKATYQHSMSTIFLEHLGKTLEWLCG